MKNLNEKGLDKKALLEHFNNPYARMHNKLNEAYSVKEVLTSSDSRDILPSIFIDVMRDSIEPQSLVSKYFPVIETGGATSIEFPAIGVMRARFVQEGQEYQESYLDFQRMRATNAFQTRKVGLLVKITEEMISESLWDVIGLHLKKAGSAMTRFKEEWIFREFMKNGHILLDNSSTDAQYHTTGLGPSGQPNNTLSVFDFIDMYTAMINNGYNPTTLLVHPLTWATFMKTDILGGLGNTLMQFGNQWSKPVNNPTMGPNAGYLASTLPFPLEVVLSPFIPIDRINRTFDMFLIDRENIGAMLVKYDMKIEEFDDPARDIKAIKVREKYQPGIFDQGRAIMVARKVSLAPAYPRIPVIKTV